MTETTTAVGIETLFIFVTVAEPERRENLADFAANFTNVRALLSLAALAHLRDSVDIDLEQHDLLFLMEMRQAEEMAKDFEVVRVTYRSPLEIVLQVATVSSLFGGMGWVVTMRLVKMWERIEEIRKKHYEADRVKFQNEDLVSRNKLRDEVYESLIRDLRLDHTPKGRFGRNQFNGLGGNPADDPWEESKSRKLLEERLTDATLAAIVIEDIKVEPDV